MTVYGLTPQSYLTDIVLQKLENKNRVFPELEAGADDTLKQINEGDATEACVTLASPVRHP